MTGFYDELKDWTDEEIAAELELMLHLHRQHRKRQATNDMLDKTFNEGEDPNYDSVDFQYDSDCDFHPFAEY